jgi:hypothetical protein
MRTDYAWREKIDASFLSPKNVYEFDSNSTLKARQILTRGQSFSAAPFRKKTVGKS